MDLDSDGQLLYGSSRSARRTPGIRSWFPSPFFFYQRTVLFFGLSKARPSRVIKRSFSVEEFPGMTEGLLGAFEIPAVTSVVIKDPQTLSGISLPVTPAKQKLKSYSKTDFDETVDAGHATSILRSRNLCSTGIHERRTSTHLRSDFLTDAASGPCPCHINESDPSRLRDFLLEENIADSAYYKSIHQDYGTVTRQCTSLRDEVDRLEASLGLRGELGMNAFTSPLIPSKEIRVVLYGDLGSALADELPKDSLSESLYSVNVKLLSRLEIEKNKVEKKNKDHLAMTAQLETLVTTVASFQARFEERITDIQLRFIRPVQSTTNSFDRAGGTESGFGDANLLELEYEEVASTSNENLKQYVPVNPAETGEDIELKTELRGIVSDLQKVAREIAARENGWIDEQKSWALYATDLSTRVMALRKLVVAVKSSGSTDRAFFGNVFCHLQSDLSACFSNLNYSPKLVQIVTATLASSASTEARGNGDHSSPQSLEDRVAFWQKKSCQVESQDERDLEEIRNDYSLLEERYQFTVKRLQNSGQEKLLLDSNVEKLKDELALAQYEKEFLLKKNERTLMSLNTTMSEKNAVESALKNLSADFENISTTRWALESSTVTMRDTVTGLQHQLEILMAEKARCSEEKDELFCIADVKSSELKQAHAQLDTCIHDSDQLKQLLAAAELLTENLRSDLGSHREEIVGKTGAIAQNEIQLAVARSDLQTSENMYQSLTSAFNGEQLKLGNELLREQEVVADLRVLLNRSFQSRFNLGEENLELQQRVKNMDVRFLALGDAKSELKKSFDSRSSALFDLDQQLADLLERLKISTESNTLLVRNLDDRDRAIVQLRKDVEVVDSLRSELAASSEVVNMLQNQTGELVVLRTRLGEDKQTIDRFLKEIDDKAARVFELEQEIDRRISGYASVAVENEKLRTDLESASTKFSNQIYESTMQLESLQHRSLKEKCKLQAENGDFRSGIIEMDRVSSGYVVEIDQLKVQLNNNLLELTKHHSEKAQLEESLSEACISLAAMQEQVQKHVEESQVTTRDLDCLLQEKLLLETNLRIYSELVGIICSEILTHNMDGQQHLATHQIFTPEGIFMEEDVVSPDSSPDQTGRSFVCENDSGFVGGQNHLEAEQLALQRRSATTIDLKGLIDRFTGKSLLTSAEASYCPTANPAALSEDLQRAHIAVLELQTNRKHSETLLKTVQDFTERMNGQYSIRDQLALECSELRQQTQHLSREVERLTEFLASLSTQHERSQIELKSKTAANSDLENSLNGAVSEIARLREVSKSSSMALQQTSDVLEDKKNAIATLEQELSLKKTSIVRSDGRIRELLSRVNANDSLVADLSHQLRETELRIGTADNLRAKEEALKALEHSLDFKIAHLQTREEDIRVMERKLAGFVTNQLELANREADSVKKTFDLDLRDNELRSRENDMKQKMVQLLQMEDKLRTIELDMEANDAVMQLVKQEETAVKSVNRGLTLDVENLQRSLRSYEDQNLSRDSIDRNNVHELARWKMDAEKLQSKLTHAEMKATERELQFRLDREERERLEMELQSVSTGCDHLQGQLESLKLQNVATEAHDHEVQRLQKMLADRSTQVAALGAEEKRLRHLLQSSDAKLTDMRQTFQDMEEHLKSKKNGRDSLDSQFNTLNALYADLFLKYRTLSEAHDEMQIEVVRSRDEQRDVKRELDKLSDFLRRHLSSGTRTFTISREDTSEDVEESTVTKDLISVLRLNLEQLLQERLYEGVSQDSLLWSTQHRSNQIIREDGTVIDRDSSDSSDMMRFRGKVMDRMFENSSRENISREEFRVQADQKRPKSSMGSSDSMSSH